MSETHVMVEGINREQSADEFNETLDAPKSVTHTGD